ncbi:Endonuclease/exonuclease/phosphatase [Crassisporium funariophilum]|nr:Endonuclease/exonuclease/phosphatase [Crassisporium funariophilum]
MALKRKSTASASVSSTSDSKKVKVDFFAPRNAPQAISKPGEAVASFYFEAKKVSDIRVVAWNVNGIMSVNEKILKKYLEVEDPTILILTETKYSKGKPDILCLKTRFKYQYWGVDPRPGHAGTAVLSKYKPLNVSIGLPSWDESSGRYVELEFAEVFLIGTYAPNSGENFKTMDLKRKWSTALSKRLSELEVMKPVIWGGDFNCIMSKKDIDSTAQRFWNLMSGLSEEEREQFTDIIQRKDLEKPQFVDVWRKLHPNEEDYTHFSDKFGGWRLDSFMLSEMLLERTTCCEIRHELKDLKLSDHWPVTLDIALTLSAN